MPKSYTSQISNGQYHISDSCPDINGEAGGEINFDAEEEGSWSFFSSREWYRCIWLIKNVPPAIRANSSNPVYVFVRFTKLPKVGKYNSHIFADYISPKVALYIFSVPQQYRLLKDL